VIVLEALSRQVYDVDQHLRDGEEEPPVAKTKQRIDRFVEDALQVRTTQPSGNWPRQLTIKLRL